MIRRVLASMLMSAALFASTAYAEDVVAYQAEGDAPKSASDPRVMALDEAFARAVNSALGDIVAGDVRTAHKGDLDREIVGHARLWVVKYTVTKDETNDDRRELTVSVRIDRDKLRARLGELSIPMKDASAPAPGEPALPPAKTITILLRLVTPAGTRADYGANADKDTPGVGALTTLLRNAGYAVRRAPSSGDGGAALSDDQADALAGEAKADSIAVASVTVGDKVAVRGLPTTASLVTAELRMLDRPKKMLGQATASAAARGDELGYAIDRSLLAAAADVLPPPPAKLAQPGTFHGEDTPIPEAGVVLVRLPARTPYSLVLSEQKFLAGAKGVRAATLRRLSPGGWVIGVTTAEPIEQVARIAKKPPSTDTQSSVKIVGDVVEVTLQGAL